MVGWGKEYKVVEGHAGMELTVWYRYHFDKVRFH